MNVITFRCAACQHQMRVSADKAGRRAKCTKCGKEVRVPPASPSPAEAAAPADALAKAKVQGGDAEDDGGSYSFVDQPAPAEEADATKKKKEPDGKNDKPAENKEEQKPRPVRRKIRKKTVQFGEDWLKFRFALLLVFAGACIWILVWLLHTGLVLLNVIESPSYGAIVEGATQSGEVRVAAVATGLLTGGSGIGKILEIIEQVATLGYQAAFLCAFLVCLGVPNVFGTRGQALGMVILCCLSLLVDLLLKVLPVVGVMPYTITALLAPEAALNEANIDRALPIHVFWCAWPFWETLAAILLQVLSLSVPIGFCVFLRAASMALKDDEWLEPRAFMLLRLGFGQFFIFLVFYMLSISGTSLVLRTALLAIYVVWRGFLLGFIISLAKVALQGNARVQYLLTPDEDE